MKNIMWAVKCNYPEYVDDQLLGWGYDPNFHAPVSKNGRMGTALYPSRELARELLKIAKKAYPKATIVKVRIVKEEP
jgi:tRNA-dihydrouridine synthase